MWDALPGCGEVHSMRVLQHRTSLCSSLNVPPPTSPINWNQSCRCLYYICPTSHPEFEALRCTTRYSTNGSFWRWYVLVVDQRIIPLVSSVFISAGSEKYGMYLRNIIMHSQGIVYHILVQWIMASRRTSLGDRVRATPEDAGTTLGRASSTRKTKIIL